MPNRPFEWGTWWVICDVCGSKYKNVELMKRWDGKMVCSFDFETRHPQDYARIPRTEKPVPWTNPEQPDREIEVDWVDPSVGTQT